MRCLERGRFPLIFFISLLAAGCSPHTEYSTTRQYMGTVARFDFLCEGPGDSAVQDYITKARKRLDSIENRLSIFLPSSEVTAINNDRLKSIVTPSRDVYTLIKKSMYFYGITEGAFDITVAPLTETWGFGADAFTCPSRRRIETILDHVGMYKIRVDEDKKAVIFDDPLVAVDFGAIAKGFAVDEAIRLAEEQGLENGIINIGGDLYCLGKNGAGKPWSIGIKDPRIEKGIIATIRISDMAVATSGIYENFRIRGQKRFSHIIDPRTGSPVSNDVSSVTVVAPDCVTADALATAILVLGSAGGKELAEKIPGAECLLIINHGRGPSMTYSSGMKKYLDDSREK